MDKNVWLEVIRKELELLEKLAAGMMNDNLLSREEIELAISRSAIVTREFELLLKQTVETVIPVKQEEFLEMGQEQVHEVAAIDVAENYSGMDDILIIHDDEEINLIQEEEVVTNESTHLSVPDAPIHQPAEPVTYLSPVPDAPVPLDSSIPEETSFEASPEAAPAPSPAVNFPPPVIAAEPQLTTADPLFFRQGSSEYFAVEKDTGKANPPLFKPSPIKSLKEGLTLNDRYLFQRELFNNDKLRLDEAVATLDRLSSIQEAVEYLKANFRWTKSEASEKFVLLVKRRFSEQKG